MAVDPQTRALLDRVTTAVERAFVARRSILSFEEYLDDVMAHPRRHLRGAAQYLMDVIKHFGEAEVKLPTGKFVRRKLCLLYTSRCV